MPSRTLILSAVAIALGGATIWMAAQLAGNGESLVFVALGPLLLIAAFALRWARMRR
jgi:NhaP-type Na+/H+ or K+/H+ antiporter